MDIHTGQQRPFPALSIAVVLVVLCIFPGQYWISNLIPGISGLVSITPSIVLLDIPLPLPVPIDLILVPGLFLILYPITILLYPSRSAIPTWQLALQRSASAFAGFLALLSCILSGGLIYYFLLDFLPRNIRNGINSFGMIADINLPFPGFETLHLRGSMILFGCFVIGMFVCIQKIRKDPGKYKPGQLTREQRMTPYEKMMRERRMKEKKMAQEARMIQDSWKKNQTIARPDRIELPRLCHSRPVMRFEPEAVNYMPME